MKNIFIFLIVIPLMSGVYAKAQSGKIAPVVHYFYEGTDPIADSAAVLIGNKVAATARALKVVRIPKDIGYIIVRERYYDHTGKLVYEGKVWIRFGVSGNMILKEEKISGTKPKRLFTLWPSEIDLK